MTTSQIILSSFELLLIIAIVVGVIFEYKLIDFETALKAKIKKLWEVIR